MATKRAGSRPERGTDGRDWGGRADGGERLQVPRAVSPRPVPEDAATGHPHLLFNRELSWIDFNWRVLAQAVLDSTPLLERVRFLSIAESNLDEFIRTRVGGLRRQHLAGVTKRSAEGRTPAEQLGLLHDAMARMQARMVEIWQDDLKPRLEEIGVEVVTYADLTDAEADRMHGFFRRSLYPILTPLAVDPGHPFPFISNLSLNLAFAVLHPGEDQPRFARVKVPPGRSRWIPVDETGRRLVPLEAIIARHADELFRGLEVRSAHVFRVTRNADIGRDDEEAEDLIRAISEELRERRFAPVVRLEVERSMPGPVRELLCRELEITAADIVEVDGPLGLADLHELADLPIAEHRFPVWEPRTPPALRPADDAEGPDIFATLRAGDVLVHHPYDSFTTSVQHFLEVAATDPQVVAVKQTLYRTGEDSPVVRALIRAADAGKQVAALVEITASFDEESNIEWAQMLERHGVHVTYGLIGLKTHAKTALVVREEGDQVRTYCHIGTGNYHSRTARLYTDLGLLTADPVLGLDVVDLFHMITGHAPDQQYDELIVAPRHMRARFEALIDREIEHQREGRGGRITAKMNALDDVALIRRLYDAARAGVSIDLVVRGHCRLRPGLQGFSDTIRVFSIIGRFLEHDRIFRFHNDGQPELFIGSADWRRRNMEERVEAVVRVKDPAIAGRLSDILDTALADNSTAWDLGADGRWTPRRPGAGEEPVSFQEALMGKARRR